MRPAPTPEDTFTKTMLAWPRPAPRRCSARAPRLASLSTWVGRPNRSSAACCALTPTQPGRIAAVITVPSSASGVGRPRPMLTMEERVAALRSRSRSISDEARSSPSPCAWSAASGSRSTSSTWPPRSPSATRTCRWPKSMPTTRPASREMRTVVPRRPLPTVVSTSPAAARSRTMLDTVAGASPVVRAMSAWETGASPPCWSRATTRRWLAARSDPGEPGEPGEPAACPSAGSAVRVAGLGSGMAELYGLSAASRQDLGANDLSQSVMETLRSTLDDNS